MKITTRVLVALVLLTTVQLYGQVSVVWVEDWETPAPAPGNWQDNWVPEGTGGGMWEVGESGQVAGEPAPIMPSGPNCLATRLGAAYDEYHDTRLRRLATIVVPPASEHPHLRFWHWYSYSCGDTASFEIRDANDPAATWQAVRAYTGTSGGVWSSPRIDLSDYAGQEIEISFRHVTTNCSGGAWDTSWGWYVDDLMLCIGEANSPNPQTLEGSDPDWWIQSGWRVTAGTWQIGEPMSGPGVTCDLCSGTQLAGTVLGGDYYEYIDSELRSRPVTLPTTAPVLRFRNWYSFSCGDRGEVWIYPTDGSVAAEVVEFTGTAGGWEYAFCDLALFAGMEVEVAFRFISANCSGGAWDVSAGWFLDDFVVLPMQAEEFRRGDINLDQQVNLADPIQLLDALFGSAGMPLCADSADANDDGMINLADAIAVLGHLFSGGGPLPAPFPGCGTDPTIDGMGCGSYPSCP